MKKIYNTSILSLFLTIIFCNYNLHAQAPVVIGQTSYNSGNITQTSNNGGYGIHSSTGHANGSYIELYSNLADPRVLINGGFHSNQASAAFVVNNRIGSNWNDGFRTDFIIQRNGNVIIGAPLFPAGAATYKLNVGGMVRADEVRINTTGADFVFDEKYKLPNLSEVEKFIKINKHLPEVPSAKEMQLEGMSLSTVTTTLLQKVEELTLYMIELEKKNASLQFEMNNLKATSKLSK